MVTRGISRDPTSLARSALMPLSSHVLLGSRRLATRLRFSRRLGMESIERLAGGRPASGGRGRWGGDAGLEHEGAQLDDIDGGASPPPLESPALTFAMCPGRRRCRSPPTSTYTARTLPSLCAPASSARCTTSSSCAVMPCLRRLPNVRAPGGCDPEMQTRAKHREGACCGSRAP